MTDRLTPLLAVRPWLLADGATGSNLFERGLQSGDAPELWNSDHPDRIAELQRAFVEAGADIILTNSFGGTRHRLKLHKAEDRVAELNEKAARICACRSRPRGPRGSGRRQHGSHRRNSRTTGPVEPGSGARRRLPNKRCALARGGADLLWIETMSSVEETEAAIAGARDNGPAGRRHLEFRYQRANHDGHHPCGTCGTASQAPPGRLRQQLRHRTFGTGGLHGESRDGLGAVSRSGREGQLRHPAIRRRRNTLQRHPGVDGAIRLPVIGCRRADHRRLLRNDARALARHAPGAREPCARANARLWRPSNPGSAPSRRARPRNCAGNSAARREPPRRQCATEHGTPWRRASGEHLAGPAPAASAVTGTCFPRRLGRDACHRPV